MYCFVVVFVTVAVVVATAPYFDLKGSMQCHDIIMEKYKMCKFVLCETSVLVIMKEFLFC